MVAGQLVGIAMGVQLVSEKIRAVPDFPPKLKLLLEHIILSHHGSLELHHRAASGSVAFSSSRQSGLKV